MIPPFADSPEFRRLLAGRDDVDLVRIALELARDAYPGLDPDTYLRRIDDLAGRVRDRCRPSAAPAHVIGQINWVLYVEEGFRGNTEDYYDPRNSYLNEVLDRRTGIPISLSALYRAVAGRAGLEMDGVNLPCHFLLRADSAGEPLFVDPFHEGAVLDRAGCRRLVAEAGGSSVEVLDEHLEPCTIATIIARMLRNLKATYLGAGDFLAALPVQRRLAALLADEPLERRDHGVVALHAGRPGEAIDPLSAYLRDRPLADDAEAVAAFLRAARREIASWN